MPISNCHHFLGWWALCSALICPLLTLSFSNKKLPHNCFRTASWYQTSSPGQFDSQIVTVYVHYFGLKNKNFNRNGLCDDVSIQNRISISKEIDHQHHYLPFSSTGIFLSNVRIASPLLFILCKTVIKQLLFPIQHSPYNDFSYHTIPAISC